MDMLNFEFSEKGLGVASLTLVVYKFQKNNLLTDQLSLSGLLHFLRYWPGYMYCNYIFPSQ